MPDFIRFVLFIVAGMGSVLFGIDSMGARSCAIYSEETGVETKWRHLDQCYIRTPTGFMRWDEFKVRATTREQAQ